MEMMMMSKTKRSATPEDHRPLADSELDAVSGAHDARKGGAIIVYDYGGSALRTQHSAKVTVPDIKLGVS
jgi:hypothetical protein